MNRFSVTNPILKKSVSYNTPVSLQESEAHPWTDPTKGGEWNKANEMLSIMTRQMTVDIAKDAASGHVTVNLKSVYDCGVGLTDPSDRKIEENELIFNNYGSGLEILETDSAAFHTRVCTTLDMSELNTLVVIMIM